MNKLNETCDLNRSFSSTPLNQRLVQFSVLKSSQIQIRNHENNETKYIFDSDLYFN